MRGLAVVNTLLKRRNMRCALTQMELAPTIYRLFLRNTMQIDDRVHYSLYVSTWPDVAVTQFSWFAEYGFHRIEGTRYLALRHGQYVVYHESTDLAIGAVPPTVAGSEWWGQTVGKFFPQIVNELTEWRDGLNYVAPRGSGSFTHSSIPEGVRPYVLL